MGSTPDAGVARRAVTAALPIPATTPFVQRRAQAGQLAAALRDAARTHGWDAPETQALWVSLQALIHVVRTDDGVRGRLTQGDGIEAPPGTRPPRRV